MCVSERERIREKERPTERPERHREPYLGAHTCKRSSLNARLHIAHDIGAEGGQLLEERGEL